jgi:signal transduction histidine kinase
MNMSNLIAIGSSLGVGCGVLYANPKRAINRSFFLASVYVALWLYCLSRLTEPSNPDPTLWIRITSAVGSFIPLLLWIIKDCAKGGRLAWATLRNGAGWAVVGGAMAALCFTESFIPAASSRENPLFGAAWSLFALGNVGAYIVLFMRTVSDMRACTGIRKVELQILVFGGAASGLTAILLATLGPILRVPYLPRTLALIIVAFYAFTAWAITTQKVFDSRHLFRTALSYALSIGITAGTIGLALEISPNQLGRPVLVVGCAALIVLVYNRFNLQLLRASMAGVDRQSLAVRSSIVAAGRDEVDYDMLLRRYTSLLEVWSRTDRAYILTASYEIFSSGDMQLPFRSSEAGELLKERWATPESLLRQRELPGRTALLAFMREHDFGVLVCAPSEDGFAPFIVALTVRADRTPYTWSEIKMLQEWIDLMEHTLSRISLTRQARESEQLKTAGLLGASLAHEIRNPLVALKTIAQSAKARYNDPEFKRLLIDLVPTEIERIERLVSGLMDLGRPQHPHFERMQLNEVVANSLKLVTPKALDDAVKLTCHLDATPDEITADRAAVRQVILNLVMNAIQAVSATAGPREVIVRTEAGAGTVVLEVADNGPGIPAEMRRKLFQPFATSNKTSGIGLGLAISADLVKLHNGQISLVERDNAGTTFRVTLPCQQPSS